MTSISLFSSYWANSGKRVKWKKKGNKLLAPASSIVHGDRDANISLSKKKDRFTGTDVRLESIDFGEGDDSITASRELWIGYYAYGQVDMGQGNDTIQVSKYLEINPGDALDLGSGNDSIAIRPSTSGTRNHGLFSRGSILGGDGDDEIYCDYNAGGASIFLSDGGAIDMGPGNDMITGFNGTGLSASIAKGGFISTGEGDDTIDFVTGGVVLGTAGHPMEAFINLGNGNDSAFLNVNKSSTAGDASGPGGYFSGGDGEDTLYLPEGYYKITKATGGNGIYTFNFDDGRKFSVDSFERLGNALTGVTSVLREANVYVIDDCLYVRNQDGDFLAY